MSKTQEELNLLKQEYKTLSIKLKELTDEEIKQVTGGNLFDHIKKLSSDDLKGIGLEEDPTLKY